MDRIQAAIKRQSKAATSSGGRRLLQWTDHEWKVFQKTPPFGGLVERLVPIRPPLSTLYEVHYDTTFKGATPTDLMEALIEQAKRGNLLNVATVIDASGNGLYYHERGEWNDWDVEYVKLLADPDADAGHDASPTDIVPSKSFVGKFLQSVQQHFAGDRRDENIAVFGARGYNTAAFLIVCYLVELKGMSLNDALETYKRSNPMGIYSTPCLEGLYKRYYSTLKPQGLRIRRSDPPSWDPVAVDDSPEVVGADILTDEDMAHPFVRSSHAPPPSAPVQPHHAPPNAASASATSHQLSYRPAVAPVFRMPEAKKAPTKKRKIRTWEDEVEPFAFGQAVPVASAEHERLVAVIAELTGGASDGFPGCEATSLTMIHIRDPAKGELGTLTKEYLVTWRARGKRCLILALKDANYLVSRAMTFTKINVKFPRKRALHENTDKTLVDGVLVEDRDGDNGVVLRFLAFDVIAWEGSPVYKSKLEKRLQCLQNEIILPRKADRALEGAEETFRVRMKDHFRLEKTEHLLRNFIPKVTHNVEGLIFTPKQAAYGVGGFEADAPVFKFVGTDAMGGLDGSLTEAQLLQHIQRIPK
ncbi:hypothetical protein H310_10979 [Aphanomyces invadans]|uniref:mRNA capping enzyme adenylation domain-containing protein n=1 Tax=Aphanomyces invadans TaxID=157072 RepID=A0A024TNG1_9STRA|nr:hypothetical protein H310_10979 [Aphanomyces invadans]ETV95534.1 hypothetical protein H310_10979 [Aphanomyces invadans]|eukprot:XP_008875727.1 hypothetical protein H310_10979 [Aphanomyces invadans]